MSFYAMAESVLAPVIPQIQVTLNCNFRCSYCFQNHSPSEIIDPATAEIILKKCADYNRSRFRRNGRAIVEVFWHGGEPLLAGVEFFREMIRLQSRIPDVTFKNHLQTNGSLLSGEFASFLVQNAFQVGFSLDGPKEINDIHRRAANAQKSAFDATMRGIENYLRHAPNGGRPPIIAVITRQSINRAAEIYAFFKELSAEVQLDIYDLRCVDLNPSNEHSLFRLAPDQSMIRDFLTQLFDLWFNDYDRKVDFKELREELDRVLKQESCIPNLFHKKRCSPGRTIFDPRGAVFACDQYVNDSATAIGYIERDTVAAIMRRKAALWNTVKRVIRRSPDMMACSACEWGASCMGGCLTCMKYNSMLLNARAQGLPDDRWRNAPLAGPLQDLAGETYYCEALRALRRHIQGAVQRELGKKHVR
jgi:uncharacterized protein